MNWLQFLFVVLLRISLLDISDWANLTRGHSLDPLRCCDIGQDLTLLICLFASKFLNILIRKWMRVHLKLAIHEIARLYSVWYCWVQLLSKHSYEGCHRGSICIILTSSLWWLNAKTFTLYWDFIYSRNSDTFKYIFTSIPLLEISSFLVMTQLIYLGK